MVTNWSDGAHNDPAELAEYRTFIADTDPNVFHPAPPAATDCETTPVLETGSAVVVPGLNWGEAVAELSAGATVWRTGWPAYEVLAAIDEQGDLEAGRGRAAHYPHATPDGTAPFRLVRFVDEPGPHVTDTTQTPYTPTAADKAAAAWRN